MSASLHGGAGRHLAPPTASQRSRRQQMARLLLQMSIVLFAAAGTADLAAHLVPAAAPWQASAHAITFVAMTLTLAAFCVRASAGNPQQHKRS